MWVEALPLHSGLSSGIVSLLSLDVTTFRGEIMHVGVLLKGKMHVGVFHFVIAYINDVYVLRVSILSFSFPSVIVIKVN